MRYKLATTTYRPSEHSNRTTNSSYGNLESKNYRDEREDQTIKITTRDL